jgi:hypothetical protein
MPAPSEDQRVPRSEEVFISYSRKDKEFVRRLDEELKRRDREAWVDWEGIPPGDKWEKTIYGAIEATHTFIFVLTPDSIASDVCGKEIAHAAANNKHLVPIVHRDVADDTVPKSLGGLNWIFFRDTDDFEKATDTLIRALDTDLKWVRAHTVEGLRSAMQVDPANPRVIGHLGRRLADQALKQGSDPDESRRARGEADFLTSRAVKLAPDNEEVKKLRDEVVKLLRPQGGSSQSGN